MTIDTACSGSLISIDLACRYLQTGDADGAIVAGCNLYMSPEHNMDLSAMRASASLSGRCHTFDAKADGYIKAEAVNTVILKRLDDALRDGDPIRAVIRGSSTNSDGLLVSRPQAQAHRLLPFEQRMPEQAYPLSKILVIWSVTVRGPRLVTQ